MGGLQGTGTHGVVRAVHHDDFTPLRGPAGRLTRARTLLEEADRVLILTGAGVSAESGVPTFRDALEGEWRRHRPQDLATPEAFAYDPLRVWSWYDYRRRRINDCSPNAAHRSLARWILKRPDARRLYTQNVDGLHDRALDDELGGGLAGERDEAAEARPRPLHGDLFGIRCPQCSWSTRHRDPIDTDGVDVLPHCPQCGALARPAVVWFGEALDSALLDHAMRDAQRASVCLSIGTSAVVHPAASLPRIVVGAGGTLIEVNPEPTPLSGLATIRIASAAGVVIPELLD